MFAIGVCYQITSIISESSFPLFRWLRTLPYFLGNLFGCFLCISVWVGFLCSFCLFDFGKEIEFSQYTWFTSGLFYSFITWWLHLLEGKVSE